ncbi:MAG TPA: 4,5-DOPA dioxygenase extradiol [Anaerolineae bacterium]|nr:4,5-DOPA dioxygenase extradiol [Anaerolineae bacterium]
MSLNQTLRDLHAAFPDSDQKMPVLFVGHGNPLNAIEDNEYSRAWAEVGQSLPRPNAILCISAHWETIGTQVTGMNKPKTIHDFGGFPRELFEFQYAAPGSIELAYLTKEVVKGTAVDIDQNWGLDHGTWSVLCRMFPEANVPVVQLSLDRSQKPDYHYALGKELQALRNKGVLIIGSGNIVHNLRTAVWREGAYDWAIEFDAKIKDLVLDGNHDSIVHYQTLGQTANLAIPTDEHYLPLLYALSLQAKNEQVKFFADRVTMGSLSMRSLWIS